MSALTTRQDARERLRKVFEGALDQLIPPDESIPLKGTRFADFEDQVEVLGREVLPVALEERAALEGNADGTPVAAARIAVEETVSTRTDRGIAWTPCNAILPPAPCATRLRGWRRTNQRGSATAQALLVAHRRSASRLATGLRVAQTVRQSLARVRRFHPWCQAIMQCNGIRVT